MKKYFVLILLVLLSLSFAQAQKTLVVKKFNGKRRYQYTEGERVKLKLKGTGEVLKGNWQYAGVDLIVVGWTEVRLEDIRWIDVSGNETGIYLLRKGRDLLFLAGLGYFTVSQLNSITQTGKFLGDEGVLRVSGVLAGAGLLCGVLDRVFLRRKLPVGGERFSIALTDHF